jgi:hypothetical protein
MPAAPYLIVADHDRGVFAVEGPMTDSQMVSWDATRLKRTRGRHALVRQHRNREKNDTGMCLNLVSPTVIVSTLHDPPDFRG